MQALRERVEAGEKANVFGARHAPAGRFFDAVIRAR
jgi:hypothetical protein